MVTIVISGIGLITYDDAIHEKKWQGVTGLILGVLYLFVNLYNYGHIL